MSWRERARELQKCPSGEVSKVSKEPSAPFETAQDGHFKTSLADFQAALVLGRLVVCGNCAHFDRGAEFDGLGHCRQFDTESWPFVPFTCTGFTVSPTPAAPAYLPDRDGSRAIARQAGGRPAYHHRRAP